MKILEISRSQQFVSFKLPINLCSLMEPYTLSSFLLGGNLLPSECALYTLPAASHLGAICYHTNCLGTTVTLTRLKDDPKVEY